VKGRVQVGAAIDTAAGRLLGRHVGRSPEHQARGGDGRLIGRSRERPGQTEVDDSGLTFVEQDIARLDIAVDDTLPMRVAQRPRDLNQESYDVRDGELALPRKAGSQRLAGDERHGVEQQLTGLAGAQQGNDVGVLELGRQLDFSAEALGAQALGELGGDDLDNHSPTERRLRRQVHARHPRAWQLTLEDVGRTKRRLQNFGQGWRHGTRLCPEYKEM
jgi:hypothetical protein